MASLLLVYAAVSLLLLGVAIYEHTAAASLSLPLSSAATISTIILPILSFLNTVFFTVRSRPTTRPRPSSSLLPAALQILQTIITTILATTFLGDMIPSSARQCLLSTRWQALWTGHDAATIRRIQDTLECCGLNSVKDRAWPFPNKENPQPGCAALTGRRAACAGPWAAAMRAAGGVEFGVVLGVGVLQLLNILLFQYAASRGRRSGGAPGWMSSAIKRLTGGGDEYSDRRAVNRPLLEHGDGSDADEDQHHGTRGNLTNGVGSEARPARQTPGRNGYGGTRAAPAGARVEPSHLESSPWAGDGDGESEA